MPVLGSQPAGDVSHKPGGRLPLLSARPAATEPPWGSEGGGKCRDHGPGALCGRSMDAGA